MKEQFLSILRENVKREGIEELIDFLEKSDFFTSPASSRYHNACEGGLCKHSISVYNVLVYEMEETFGDDWDKYINRESVAIVALLHDLCKINTYEKYMRNVKDDATGRWDQVPSYRKKVKFPMGHGGKSVFLIMNYIKLKPDEAEAIYWHMGAYDTSTYNSWDENSEAWQRYPLAFLLHIADMKATYIIENEYGIYDD